MRIRNQIILHIAPLLAIVLSTSFAACSNERADAQNGADAFVSRTESKGEHSAERGVGEGESHRGEYASNVRLPVPMDYGAPGSFDDVVMIEDTGPDGDYTLFRPGASLGRDGFKHPIVAWGNGIITTPGAYETTLKFVATHGFVIIASNSRKPERPLLSAGLDWLVRQNASNGPLKGKLDTSREATVGYSWGGGAAIDTANRPNVRCTVSLQGMPPRRPDAFDTMHNPLLLITSTSDTLVSPTQYVTPNFQKSTVQTFYATLDDPTAGHLYIADEGSFYCLASIVLGSCKSAKAARAPMMAWLRMWVYGEKEARKFFYGKDCVLCRSPWIKPRRKNWE